MHSIAFLSILALATAAFPTPEQGDCLVDGGEAISDAMDATLFVWAASKRCGGNGKKEEEAKCAVDISSTLKSVISMTDVILKAVDKCHELKIANKACGMSIGTLSAHTAALSSSSGEMAQKCPEKRPAGGGTEMGPQASPVMCTMDMKNVAKSMFKSVKELLALKSKCKDPDTETCVMNSLDIASALSGFGDYLAGAVGECSRTTAFGGTGEGIKESRIAECAEGALDLIHHASAVSAAGLELSQHCAAKPERLFEDFDAAGDKRKDLSTTFMLGALLPVSAIAGLVGGRFYARRQSRPAYSFLESEGTDI